MTAWEECDEDIAGNVEHVETVGQRVGLWLRLKQQVPEVKAEDCALISNHYSPEESRARG